MPEFEETGLIHTGAVIHHPDDGIRSCYVLRKDDVNVLRKGVVGICDQFLDRFVRAFSSDLYGECRRSVG